MVQMNLRLWNRNYVGTQFGGSLYSMTDPFLMVTLIENLGPEYVVWDKSAAIYFRRPGRGRVHCTIQISKEEVETIRRKVDDAGKLEPQFRIQVLDDSGKLVAEVEKVLYVRRKDRTHLRPTACNSQE